ncbi:zinc finger protein [Musa troglodytarum]|uniref:Zinc finger protein n=1 Tax=Musa troglodytarum TaxID=320322 RepID=A0A9E7GT45_9LILI|nr:zinc finger protein [Musa troglodytarum]
MDRPRCRLCGRRFSNGHALGGHMRSHRNSAARPAMAQQALPSPSASSSSFSFSSSVAAGGSSTVVHEGESDAESSFRRRLSRPRRQVDAVADAKPVGSVSDASTEEDVARCLMLLSRDAWSKSRNRRSPPDRGGRGPGTNAARAGSSSGRIKLSAATARATRGSRRNASRPPKPTLLTASPSSSSALTAPGSSPPARRSAATKDPIFPPPSPPPFTVHYRRTLLSSSKAASSTSTSQPHQKKRQSSRRSPSQRNSRQSNRFSPIRLLSEPKVAILEVIRGKFFRFQRKRPVESDSYAFHCFQASSIWVTSYSGHCNCSAAEQHHMNQKEEGEGTVTSSSSNFLYGSRVDQRPVFQKSWWSVTNHEAFRQCAVSSCRWLTILLPSSSVSLPRV